ncbi:hypothetical protein HUJ04_008264 [Dendroctonus ponderosae]|nr:hypothetical protein HUJ04_008264 [Dendroctonus ponderosae]
MRDTFQDGQGQFMVKFPLKPSTSLLGHMTKLSNVESYNTDIPDYFLPHHGVNRDHSSTTKLRTVSSSGWSLNDLHLLRFRTYRYAVFADVSNMYRCIQMHPNHRSLEQIIWRENPNDKLAIYQLNTVSYEITKNLHSIPVSNGTLEFVKFDSCKTLRIQWYLFSGNLSYNIKQFHSDNPITKRTILSAIAQMYDPLGLLSPVVISKLLIQRLWSIGVSWDSLIPSDLEKAFHLFKNNLIQLNKLNSSRNVMSNGSSLVDIYCFCDASQSAYAAAVYIESQDSHRNYEVYLLCAKSLLLALWGIYPIKESRPVYRLKIPGWIKQDLFFILNKTERGAKMIKCYLVAIIDLPVGTTTDDLTDFHPIEARSDHRAIV